MRALRMARISAALLPEAQTIKMRPNLLFILTVCLGEGKLGGILGRHGGALLVRRPGEGFGGGGAGVLLADAGMAVEGFAPGGLGKGGPDVVGGCEELLRHRRRAGARRERRPRRASRSRAGFRARRIRASSEFQWSRTAFEEALSAVRWCN